MSESRFFRSVAASCELFERLTRRYEKPEWDLKKTVVNGKPAQVVPEIIQGKLFCDLVHFKKITQQKRAPKQPKILLVAPMSGHYATLLRGTVKALLPTHDVYITDWMDAGQVSLDDGPFGLDDFIDYLTDFLHTLGPGSHVMAVCQPSVPVMGAVSLMATDKDPCQPKSMTLMGGPIDTRYNPTKVNDFAKQHSMEWFESTVVARVPFGYAGAGRRVYPGFMQLNGFMSMNIDRHFGAHMKLYEDLIRGDGDSAEAHRKFYDEYMSVMDLAGEFYLETVDTVFKSHSLPKGEWVSRDRKIEPAAIEKTALLTIEGQLDDISAVGQTYAAHDLCTNLSSGMRKHYEQKGVGHYGIFNGRRWRENIAPMVGEFIKAHD